MILYKHSNERLKNFVDFFKYPIISINIFHILITLLAAFTMPNQINNLDWQSELNARLDFPNRHYNPFLNNVDTPKDDINSYKCVKIQNETSEENQGILFEKTDTLSQDDVVRKQYELLPYPAVTSEEIEELQKHYNGPDRHLPYITYPTNELDVVNHFLYKGRNDFMYKNKIYISVIFRITIFSVSLYLSVHYIFNKFSGMSFACWFPGVGLRVAISCQSNLTILGTLKLYILTSVRPACPLPN